MIKMLIQEAWIDKTDNCLVGESGLYEPYTDNIKQLFKTLMKEYGRCVSKVYVDKGNKTIAIGWVFEKRRKYDDSNDTYLQETWVTLHESEPEVETTYHYKELKQ